MILFKRRRIETARERGNVHSFTRSLLHSPTRLRPGFSIMEMLAATGIVAILTTGGLSLMLGTMRGYDRGGSKSGSDTAASLAIQKVAREVQDGKSATVDGSSRLVVQMPLVNDQNCYDRAFDGDIIAYYVSSGNLYRQVNWGTAALLSRGITGASWSVSGDTVTLNITGQEQSGRETMQTQFSEIVTLRNRQTP